VVAVTVIFDVYAAVYNSVVFSIVDAVVVLPVATIMAVNVVLIDGNTVVSQVLDVIFDHVMMIMLLLLLVFLL